MALRSGRYETLRVIASGGMATVYLARAHGAGGFERLVALKVMHPHIANDPDFVDMFLDEARLAARIHHPNVVSTSDVQEDAGGLFLVMDYIEGSALQLILRELWRQGRNLRLDIALRIFLDALAGLHAAHELNGPDGEPLYLVHRDVSPQNILVGVDGVARLTDFGVARARSRISTTQGGQLKGKLTYMAPEQVRCEPVDRRADIYAAGVVLWEILAGQRMLRSDNDAGIVQSILDGVSRSPRDVSPEVPEPIAEVCMRALRFEPVDRYATAADFALALEGAADEACVHIASTREVAAYVKELNLPEPTPLSEGRSASPDAPTMPASLISHDTTVRERVTAPDLEAHPLRASGPEDASPMVRSERVAAPTTLDWATKRKRGVALAALAAAVIAAAGWVFMSNASPGSRGSASTVSVESMPSRAIGSAGVPLDRPSAVDVPSSINPGSAEGSCASCGASGPGSPSGSSSAAGGVGGYPGSRERGGGPSSGKDTGWSSRPAPSPTTFRPREL